MNGGKNFTNLLLYQILPISVALPLKMGLGYIISFLVTVLLYREPFTKLRLLGVGLGALAIVMFQF